MIRVTVTKNSSPVMITAFADGENIDRFIQELHEKKMALLIESVAEKCRICSNTEDGPAGFDHSRHVCGDCSYELYKQSYGGM